MPIDFIAKVSIIKSLFTTSVAERMFYQSGRLHCGKESKMPNNKDLILYVHGKGGTAEEAEHYKSLFPDCDVVGLDYKSETPWEAKSEFSAAAGHDRVILIANSIGAYFSMCALPQDKIAKAYFISPIVDMEKLIGNMMLWANVSETDLRENGTVETSFGETLSWEYLSYVRSHPIRWTVPTEILYGSKDNLTDKETITAFANAHAAKLTVMENGEHWFHTPEQMAFLDAWMTAKLLTTKRLILRPWCEADADSLFEYAKDPDVGPAAGWPPHKSPEESLRIIQNGLNGAECYAVCEKESGKAIGSIELMLNSRTDLTDKDNECELGYWLGKPYWGRGYIPEAAEKLLHHAFCDLGMTTVRCGYYDGNEKSKQVQEKLGFVYHHTCFDTPVPQMNEVRIGHTNMLTLENWLKKQSNVEGKI